MSSLTPPVTGKTYWRSLEELQNTPEFEEFLHREFPVAASEFPQGVSRRRWLQLMGASFALGGLSGCRWEVEKIVPLGTRPANRIPGKPQQYATVYELGGVARPLLVTSYDGRPIKVDGNPEHPESLGGSDGFTQASVLDLYDPDRRTTLTQRTANKTATEDWASFTKAIEPLFARLRAAGGAGLCVLAALSSSPSRADLQVRFQAAFPQAKWYEFASLAAGNEREGSRLAFGSVQRTQLSFAKANTILALDADLFGGHPSSLRLAREFAENRNPEAGAMCRLYAIESQYSTTGVAADHRLALRSAQIGDFLALVEAEVAALLDGSAQPLTAEEAADPATLARPERIQQLARAAASDLVAQRGASVVTVGARQPAAVHARAHRLNALLQNVGQTVFYTADPAAELAASAASLRELTDLMAKGQVNTLVILGGNPAYDAPADLDFAAALKQVKHALHLSQYEDETSRLCTWHLPEAHPLETWSDGRSFDGRVSVGQPLIEALHGGKSDLELLALLTGDELQAGEKIVRRTLDALLGDALTETAWRKFLHDGLWAESAFERVQPELVPADNAAPKVDLAVLAAEPKNGDLEIVFTASESVYDGRYANNGWLQETPAFLTKLTWDNAALLSPATAALLGVAQGTLIKLTCDGRTLELPAYILPGQAAGSIGVALGYGRTAAGRVGGSVAQNVAPVGANANALRTSTAMDFVGGAQVEATGRSYLLATTQDHHSIDKTGLEAIGHRVGELVREATLEEYQAHPDFAQHVVHHPPLESLWTETSSEGHAWGMAIDLNKCIGCNACLVACQAENNVPIVGKEQVANGREMHWLRIDRYFHGEDVEQPEVATQPVTCQQCENAPCEQVCPVAATVHSSEGLNDMIYNRCIGTRYCGNNCPYKVRRFNFFNYHKDLEEANNQLMSLVYNPEVTVRSRGVMEKCTYCVQRIQNVKIDAGNERRPIADGEIVTACQQACPTRAIEFGDLLQAESRVAAAHANPRAYGMLAELNTKPRTKYLARVRNPHPALAAHVTGAHDEPHHASAGEVSSAAAHDH